MENKQQQNKKPEDKLDHYAEKVGLYFFYGLAAIVGIIFAWKALKVVIGMF